ncbi:MAG: hypothetical protein M1834_003121 [Cirrosporium novae-zelandiae]|nr:MAG: hypothetical protein M1834_003121 [Cirrosporium novae-zelandiae]
MTYSLTAEVFAEYGIGIATLLLRFYARFRVVGIRNFGWDDFFTVSAIVCLSISSLPRSLLTWNYPRIYGTTIGLTTETAEEVPESEVPNLRLGAKFAFQNWLYYLCLIWSLKGILLVLFTRLTLGLWQHKMANIMRYVAILTWLTCMLFHICLCTPAYRNWQVKPYPGDNCTLRKPNYVVIAVLNICTDLGILIIPFPLLFAAKIPLYRKLILGVLFSSGVFVMIAVILRTYYSLRSIEDLNTALGWASREVLVSTFAVCVPAIKPLFNTSRWISSSNKSSKKTPGYGTSARSGNIFPWSNPKSGNTTTISGTDDRGRQFELGSVGWSRRQGNRRLSSVESSERIIKTEGTNETAFTESNDQKIHVTTDVSLTTDDGNDGSPQAVERREFIGSKYPGHPQDQV